MGRHDYAQAGNYPSEERQALYEPLYIPEEEEDGFLSNFRRFVGRLCDRVSMRLAECRKQNTPAEEAKRPQTSP